MLFHTQPSALPLITSFDAANPVDDFLAALAVGSGCNPHRARQTRIIKPSYSHTTAHTQDTLELDLPGVKRDDLEVHVEGRRLTVIGKRFRNATHGTAPHAKKSRTVYDDAKRSEEMSIENTGKLAEQAMTDEAVKTANGGTDSEKDAVAEQQAPENGSQTPTKQGVLREEYSDVKQPRAASIVFKGVFRLHSKIDVERIAVVQYCDGVLNISMPYREKEVARKIVIA